MVKALPYERRKQVLRLLVENGPMSIRGLDACLIPPIKRKRLQEVLGRLFKNKLIEKRYDTLFRYSAVYYQITQHPKAEKIISEIISTDLEKVPQPFYRHVELMHSESCAIWSQLLRRLFPSATVLREHEFSTDKSISGHLISNGDDPELRPDLILLAPSQTARSRVSVAVEIERTEKSTDRLAFKLKKYASQSRLDGLIYVCGSHAISKRLLHVYHSRILDSALRIKHYGNNFFLFSDGALDIGFLEPRMFNSVAEPVSLSDWLQTLTHTKDSARRDTKFQLQGADPGSLDLEKISTPNKNKN